MFGFVLGHRYRFYNFSRSFSHLFLTLYFVADYQCIRFFFFLVATTQAKAQASLVATQQQLPTQKYKNAKMQKNITVRKRYAIMSQKNS